ALRMITLNPAKQLGIDRWVGSLDEGKDADVVVWSAHPLSSYAVAEKVFIDGKQYFDRQDAIHEAEADAREKERLRASERDAEKAAQPKPEKPGEQKPKSGGEKTPVPDPTKPTGQRSADQS